MIKKSTIVSACDSNYFWGAFLLAASIQYNYVKSDFSLLAFQLSDKENEILQQFPFCQIIPSESEISRSVCTTKPDAIFASTTDFTTWMDSDCIIKGDVSSLLVSDPDKLLIRFRQIIENSTVYIKHYNTSKEIGFIPESVKNIWKNDVSERTSPRYSSTVLSNCFTLHKKYFPFIKKWQKQMEKVIPETVSGVYNSASKAYFMTDESVLNSLLLFSHEIPKIGLYPYDKNPESCVIHFGTNPKPWIQWTRRSIAHYEYVLKMLDSIAKQGYNLPDTPKSLMENNKQIQIFFAYITFFYSSFRNLVSSKLRKWMLSL